MTPEQITKEKDAVESQILKLLKGFDTKDIDTMLTLFSTSDELLAFGTDAAEVLRSLSDWEDQLKYDFNYLNQQNLVSCKTFPFRFLSLGI